MHLKPAHNPPRKQSRQSSHTLAPLPRAALPRYLTQDEVKRLFSVISSPRDRALFALIYHYGLRVEEATLLTLESVDLKNLHLRIQRLKNGVSSLKPLWRHNAKLLRSYLRVRQDAGHWLFTGRQGAVKKRQIQQLFTDYATKARIKGRSIHSLRHSIAVHLLQQFSLGCVLIARVGANLVFALPRAPVGRSQGSPLQRRTHATENCYKAAK